MSVSFISSVISAKSDLGQHVRCVACSFEIGSLQMPELPYWGGHCGMGFIDHKPMTT